MNKSSKRSLVLLGVLLTLLVCIVLVLVQSYKDPVPVYDNGMVSFSPPEGYIITEDYSYNTTSLFMMAPTESDVPQGIISIQIDTDLSKLESKTALELFESEGEKFNSRDFTEITEDDTTGAVWDLTSDGTEMREMYVVVSKNTNTKITMRVLLNKEYFVKHQSELLSILDDLDIYGSRVLVSGNRVQDALEAQANK